MAEQIFSPVTVDKTTLIALNQTVEQWIKSVTNFEAAQAMKVINYYDGKQKEELIKVLNDPHCGRLMWRERGFIPRTRNWTKMIVAKSAMLFNCPPNYGLYAKDSDTVDDFATTKFMELKEGMDWDEFWNGFDKILRVMKTALVFQSWDMEEKCMVLDILHRGNCQVVTNAARTKILGLIRVIGNDYHKEFQIVTEQQMIDLRVDGETGIITALAQPNPFGVVTASVFHDEDEPRTSFWNTPGYDLVGANEMYNMHLTDSEFALTWAKLKTPVTNCDIDTSNQPSGGVQEYVTDPMDSVNANLASSYGLLRNNGPESSAKAAVLGGPSRPVKLVAPGGGEAPYFEYKGPDVDLEPHDRIVEGWLKGVAQDWSVRVKSSGDGTATSGFQLVVEEIDNLELRRHRQRMFGNGFKRFWKVFSKIANFVEPLNVFGEELVMCVEFDKPRLPVDEKVQEEVWSKRIAEGRATDVEYFMDTQGLSKDEAIAKVREILEFNTLMSAEKQLANQEAGIANPIQESEQTDEETINTNSDSDGVEEPR